MEDRTITLTLGPIATISVVVGLLLVGLTVGSALVVARAVCAPSSVPTATHPKIA